MAAKQFVYSAHPDGDSNNQPTLVASSPAAPALQRFKHLSSRLGSCKSPVQLMPDSIHSELAKYVKQIEEGVDISSPLEYWSSQTKMPRLTILAEDFVSAPASQAYVERIFSVAGLLSVGRRNRINKSLEMRVFLKLNKTLVDW
jgi:hypothetical protein